LGLQKGIKVAITDLNLVASYSGLRFATDVRVAGKYAYVADASSAPDFDVFDISNPLSPALLKSFDSPGHISDIDIVGGFAYGADESGIRVINVTNPSSPDLSRTVQATRGANDVLVVGKYAYLADGASGLLIYNISDPSAPTLEGTADSGLIGTVSSVDVVGDYAYILNKAGNSGWLQIYNIANKATPTLVGSERFVGLDGLPSNIDVAGNYAYLAAGDQGLQIFDISNPAQPVFKGEYSYSSGAEAWDVQVVGRYAMAAFGNGGFEVIDIADPAAPTKVAEYNPETSYFGLRQINYVTSVEVVGQYAYLTVQAPKDLGGLWIVDIGDFSSPVNNPPAYSGETRFSIVENATAIGDLSADDAEGDSISLARIEGPDGALFAVVNSQLVFLNAADFENPADSDRNNVYQLDLVLTDGKTEALPVALEVAVLNDGADDPRGGGGGTSNHDGNLNMIRGSDESDKSLAGTASADQILGLGGKDRLDGGAGDDQLDGGAGNDRVFGGDGDDGLVGGAGKDKLDGGEGSDLIFGGAGVDILIGGNGTDFFVFDARPNAMNNKDKILDFRSGDDFLAFEPSIFTRLASDSDYSDNLVVGPGHKAHDDNDYLLMDSRNHTLYYYSDGLGKAQPVPLCVLIGVNTLEATDVFTI
jgi:hypothetical protein